MRVTIAMAALALAACAPPPQQKAETPQAATLAGCDAQAQTQWAVTDGQPLTIDAAARGPTCAQAVVTLAIRSADGAVLWVEAYPTDRNFAFQQATGPHAMQAALTEWIAVADDPLRSTGKLPEWAEGAEQPGGEFPFYPEPAFAERAAYQRMRTADFDMRCLVQGMESLACFAVTSPGVVEKIGAQSFPG